MTMIVRIEFPTALDKELQIRSKLAAGSLAKCQRSRFVDDFTGMHLMGQAMSEEGVSEAFAELDIPLKSLESSLSAEEDEAADDLATTGIKKERLKPIGR